MMIIRVKHINNFTQISNVGLEDARLTFKAKGILAYLLSKPDDWQVRDRQLATVGPDGRAAVQAALRELEKYGYIKRIRERNEQGQWAYTSYVYEEPWLGNPSTDNQATVKPSVGKPSSENRATAPTPVKEPWLGKPATDKPWTGKPAAENQAIPITELPSTDNQKGGWDTNPPNGAEAPKAKPQPKRESPSFDLLTEMGVAESSARELTKERPFQEIRRQVFGWLRERQTTPVQPGLLVYRIRKNSPCPEPDPEIDRKLWDRYRTPEELEAEAEAQRELAELVDRQHAEAKHRNGAKKPRPRAQPPPSYDDPWAVAVAELSAGGQFSDGILQRAHAEMIGEKDEAQVWEISLAMQDAQEFTYMKDRGAVLIRKTLQSLLGKAVLVDVIVPETVPA